MNENTDFDALNDPPERPAPPPQDEPEVKPSDPDIEGLPGEQQQPG
ncbi:MULTISPECIES: hypothetical protein [unclassified Pseudomonas]|nr:MULTISPECIES: hypothetical protein [unclassified Pseudomonas]MCO7518132.1 hypothetical protein [Pseudomonas sp. 1]MCO7541559.1 hypothetical protein [Pseudomonas sp. VA159-2]